MTFPVPPAADDDFGPVCADGYPEHDWKPGDIGCRRCNADLADWNGPKDYSDDDFAERDLWAEADDQRDWTK